MLSSQMQAKILRSTNATAARINWHPDVTRLQLARTANSRDPGVPLVCPLRTPSETS